MYNILNQKLISCRKRIDGSENITELPGNFSCKIHSISSYNWKKFTKTSRCLIAAVSTNIKHHINQIFVYSLANVSASRLVMLEQSAESLQSFDFLINCSFASIMCIKKSGTTKDKH